MPFLNYPDQYHQYNDSKDYVHQQLSSNLLASLQKSSLEASLSEIQSRYAMQMNGFQMQVSYTLIG